MLQHSYMLSRCSATSPFNIIECNNLQTLLIYYVFDGFLKSLIILMNGNSLSINSDGFLVVYKNISTNSSILDLNSSTFFYFSLIVEIVLVSADANVLMRSSSKSSYNISISWSIFY